MASYFQAVERIFGDKSLEVDKEGGPTSLLAKQVLQDSACWQSMSALFSPTELETLFRNIYCLEIWQQLSADKISNQALAQCLFNHALINDPQEVIDVLQASFGMVASGIMDQHTLTCLQDISVPQIKKLLEQVLLYDEHLFLLQQFDGFSSSWIN
ncbi:hypothetical protein HQQ94_09480 [Shewanella sp. VB17]|uniref:hypothetical protein n=1 Tax=Shewanella sp. VB17 TaxID=2739432 RepID=UPI001562F029|nr:hypothetical protein [Shewanella sp. VB17]NRD73471.1 hypothetical protein [Shewanella sp. VB17]